MPPAGQCGIDTSMFCDDLILLLLLSLPQTYNLTRGNRQKQASLTSFFYFTLRGADLLLLDAGSLWIEPTKLLCFLPSENAIGPMLVLGGGHLILCDG